MRKNCGKEEKNEENKEKNEEKTHKNEESKEKIRKKWGNTGENDEISVKIRKIGWKKFRKIGDVFVATLQHTISKVCTLLA